MTRLRRDGGLLRAQDLPWRVIARDDAAFPVSLERAASVPDPIWIAGREVAELPMRVAIVGTRRPNGYGRQVARDLAADLAAMGACIVSGMALGIDAEAHRGALQAGGVTIAVLGSGVDVCQPSSNADLYRAIAANGSIVSEHPPGTPGHAHHFPSRNRIIAALCEAVIVVQAPKESKPGRRSGALITADLAIDMGLTVFGVPGRLDWAASAGVHELIRGGATLCRGAGDVAEALRWSVAAIGRDIPGALPPEQRAVLEALSGGPLTREALCVTAGIDLDAAMLAVAALEITGMIGPAAGGRLRRLR